MVRTFGMSVILAMGIALVLSLLPSVHLSPDQEVITLQKEAPITVTEENVVDVLSWQHPLFAYRRAVWDAPHQTLHVDFVAEGAPERSLIGEEWLRFSRGVFHAASNVSTVICRLFDEENNVVAKLRVNREEVKSEKGSRDDAASFLERRANLHIYSGERTRH